MSLSGISHDGVLSGRVLPISLLKPSESKSPDAFRTISEVATNLEVPQHVLRFWESKFQQIKPLKRGGGRRYYRPEDVELLSNIKELLYTQGLTIRGVQKLLRDGSRPHCARPSVTVSGIVARSQSKTSMVAFSPEKRHQVESLLDELKLLREMLRQSGV
jgi:DNA-binding transcriptional MerR regulator